VRIHAEPKRGIPVIQAKFGKERCGREGEVTRSAESRQGYLKAPRRTWRGFLGFTIFEKD